MTKFSISLIAVITLTLVGVFTMSAFRPDSPITPTFANASTPDTAVLLPLSANALSALALTNSFGLAEPVAQFKDRITKKTFGMHITPETSPVDQDRFAGYHTGVDVEFADTGVDIPVWAITDGVVVISKRAAGYGGVVVMKHFIQGIPVYALYGHLDPASMVPAGTSVAKGRPVGILGDDHSEETDGVRKHLHFSLYTDEKLDIRGYVPAEADLVMWLDPLAFF